MINKDGTTEVKATERVNKQHLVQALLMLATAETGMAPAPFASTLEAGVASGATKFTNSGDVPLVGKIYGWAFAAEMGAVVVLVYVELG